MKKIMSRRKALRAAGTLCGAAAAAACSGCERPEVGQPAETSAAPTIVRSPSSEEYVWISANSNLPLFVAHDHPALLHVGKELGVKVTIAGPNSVDIPALVATVEQTAARKPAGMMVVGWEPSALVAPINQAIESGIPVVCVDGDVPASKRLSFIGTDWYSVGVIQAQEMIKALKGRLGKVAMLGLIEQYIDQQAFSGFRSVAEKEGLAVMEPFQDKGNQAEAARVAAAVIQATPDLVGLAGFDSESGPGIGQAIKESGKAGKLIATCIECEAQHQQLVREGVLTAGIRQKRELFTYQGVKALYEVVHSKLRFTKDDRRTGVSPIPVSYNTGTFVVTRENVDLQLES
ncbi:MAG: substrate-binding domain-containing protein [Acidobacteriota bacterium]